jgi:hypothetical protein
VVDPGGRVSRRPQRSPDPPKPVLSGLINEYEQKPENRRRPQVKIGILFRGRRLAQMTASLEWCAAVVTHARRARDAGEVVKAALAGEREPQTADVVHNYTGERKEYGA